MCKMCGGIFSSMVGNGSPCIMRGRNSEKNAIKRLLSAPSTHEPAKNKKVHKAQQGRIAPILGISAKNQENGQGTHNK
jgi:hypothetical protein